MATADITLKVGDTLIADCTYRDSAGAPVNLDTSGITIKSAVSFPDGLGTVQLEVIPADQSVKPGQYRIRGDSSDVAHRQTSPVGRALFPRPGQLLVTDNQYPDE
jgi:hypothetical protein